MEVLKLLEGLRDKSVALTLNTIRGAVIAHFEPPQIFKTPSPDGTLFPCSEMFIRKFVHRALAWRIWRSTRAGKKI